MSNRSFHHPVPLLRRQAGLNLVELMVALTIGLFLIAGAVTVFGKTRDLYRTNDAAARLQETARYALSTIEADLRMANYWGLNSRPDLISNAAAPGETLPGALSGYQAVIDSCGENWAVNLVAYLDGSDNGYDLDCAAYGAGATAATDTLVIRRAGTDPIPVASLGATVGQMKIQTSRVQGTIFADDTLPGGYLPPLSETRALVVHGYYVAQDSDARAGTPSLRRKRLDFDAATGAPLIRDEEITAGVEDLQFEVGYDGDGDQDADFFVNPATAVLADDLPVAVRVWLLVRAELPEVGFTDDRNYDYADRAAFTPEDSFRRILVTKTIALRNTRR